MREVRSEGRPEFGAAFCIILQLSSENRPAFQLFVLLVKIKHLPDNALILNVLAQITPELLVENRLALQLSVLLLFCHSGACPVKDSGQAFD